MNVKESFQKMIDDTGCSEQVVVLLFKTAAFGMIVKEEFGNLLGGAIEKVAYNQTIDGVTKTFILAVGGHGSFPKFNLQDEEFEYVKFEYLDDSI